MGTRKRRPEKRNTGVFTSFEQTISVCLSLLVTLQPWACWKHGSIPPRARAQPGATPAEISHHGKQTRLGCLETRLGSGRADTANGGTYGCSGSTGKAAIFTADGLSRS